MTEKLKKYHLHKEHPEKLQFEVYALDEYRMRSGDMASNPHSHSYYQIIWFFEDGGLHTIDFKSYPIQKNTILFIPKDHIHAFDETPAPKGWLIHFNQSFFTHDDIDIFLKYNLFNSRENPYCVIDRETGITTQLYIDLIRKELLKKGTFGYEDIIRFSLKSLLIQLERIHRFSKKDRLAFSSYYEKQFIAYKELIEENYTKSLSVNDYASLLNVSSKTLTTITKTVVNKSASSLIHERTILEAKRLLKFTPLQIGEIAFRIGFKDTSYFIKYFKRYVNKSPNQYRTEIKTAL